MLDGLAWVRRLRLWQLGRLLLGSVASLVEFLLEPTASRLQLGDADFPLLDVALGTSQLHLQLLNNAYHSSGH